MFPEEKYRVGVPARGALRRNEVKLAGHPQVHDQSSPAAQVQNDILAAPGDAEDLPPGETLADFVPASPEALVHPDFDSGKSPPGYFFLQAADDRFDFRQFRHGEDSSKNSGQSRFGLLPARAMISLTMPF
jgi:hypothetical protein